MMWFSREEQLQQHDKPIHDLQSTQPSELSTSDASVQALASPAVRRKHAFVCDELLVIIPRPCVFGFLGGGLWAGSCRGTAEMHENAQNSNSKREKGGSW